MKSLKERDFPNKVLQILQSCFHKSVDLSSEKVSQEVERFLNIMQTEITMVKGHYQMYLPFKEGQCGVSSNQSLALERLS